MKYTPSLSMSRSLRRTLEDSGEERRCGMDGGYHGRREKPLSQRQNKDQAIALDVCAGVGAVRGIIGFLYV